MPKDNTKYRFNNDTYGKGRLVHAIVSQSIRDKQPTVEQLRQEFPKELQGSFGVFYTEQEYNARKQTSNDQTERFFTNTEDRLTTDGEQIFVCTEWGKDNITKFVKHSKKLGFDIKVYAQLLTDEEIISHFVHKPAFERNYKNWPAEVLSSFCELMRFANQTGLDIFTVNMNSGSAIRIGRKEHDDQKAREVFAIFEPCQDKINFSKRDQHKDNSLKGELNTDLFERVKASGDLQKFSQEHPISRNPYWPSDYQEVRTVVNSQVSKTEGVKPIMSKQQKAPMNQILYGPPGTGKTYHTVEAAVAAAEPQFNLLSDKSRAELKAEYDRLVLEKRIRFVTFHQSYGYEEFVEGLKARETDAGDVTYVTENGVFKNICDEAASGDVAANSAINLDGTVWKISIEATNSNPVKTHCLNNNLAAIGWGNTGDLAAQERNEYFQLRGKNDQNTLNYFTTEMAKGDLVLCINSNTSVEAIGVVIGEYQYNKQGVPTRPDYCHQRSIKWLAKGFSVDFKGINGNKQFSLPTCYPLNRLSVAEVIQHLKKYDVTVSAENTQAKKDNYVLIIDEINRGNISKIFGELITLIEPSKRSGNDNEEALTLSLPHSGKPFSVPVNLYLIGTMNTADRSLAMMDTALRRRFDFKEMMPEPELFKVTPPIKGINLELLLRKMNDRIEVLYDREHTLGHAFFIPVADKADDQDAAFAELKLVFRSKIIPLLEEYFFEDWHKIRLVLGDNQKTNASPFQFIRETELDYTALFGHSYQPNGYQGESKVYQLTSYNDNHSAWHSPESYIEIYQTSNNS